MGCRMRETRVTSCERHGEFLSEPLLGGRWSGCTVCADEQRAADLERERKTRTQARHDALLERSGLQGRFLDATFANFAADGDVQRKVLKACERFAAEVSWDSGTGLWLIGPAGTGKTHLGSAMVRHVIEKRDAAAAIFTGREIVRTLRATWRGGDADGSGMTEGAVIRDLGLKPLLVIDEVGVSFGSEAEIVQLLDIVDLRYKHCRPTVLLSNLVAKDLKASIGDRTYDRLRDGAQVLACSWPSHRGRRRVT